MRLCYHINLYSLSSIVQNDYISSICQVTEHAYWIFLMEPFPFLFHSKDFDAGIVLGTEEQHGFFFPTIVNLLFNHIEVRVGISVTIAT